MKEMLHPSSAEDYLSKALEKYSDKDTLKNIVLAGLILVVANGLSILLLQAQTGAVLASTDPYLDLFIQFLDYGLFFYVSAYVLYLVAKVLKGKGTFKEQIYLQSVVAVAISMIQAVLILLTSFQVSEDITILMLLGLPMMLTGLYSIYMDYKVVKVAHKHDKKKAALSIIGFWLTIFAVFFILYAGAYLLTGGA